MKNFIQGQSQTCWPGALTDCLKHFLGRSHLRMSPDTHGDPWTHLLKKSLDDLETHETLLCDIAAFIFVFLLLLTCFLRRPRCTAVVVFAWLSWFIWQLHLGHEAWQVVKDHGEEAARRTVEAMRAVAEMFTAWLTLFVPALHDLSAPQRLLAAAIHL